MGRHRHVFPLPLPQGHDKRPPPLTMPREQNATMMVGFATIRRLTARVRLASSLRFMSKNTAACLRSIDISARGKHTNAFEMMRACTWAGHFWFIRALPRRSAAGAQPGSSMSFGRFAFDRTSTPGRASPTAWAML